MLLAQPSSRGKYSHRIPVFSTNRIPVMARDRCDVAIRLSAICDGSGDQLLQATKGRWGDVLWPWYQTFWEHGRHLSCQTNAVYFRYHPEADLTKSVVIYIARL